MTTLATAVTTPHLQAAVRRTMAHTDRFRVEDALPEMLGRKLEELDRAVSARREEAAVAMSPSDPAGSSPSTTRFGKRSRLGPA